MLSRILQVQLCRDALLGCGLAAAACALVLHPAPAGQAVRDGLALCGNVILPSLFPFFVLSSLVIELGLARYLGRMLQPIMGPLFRLNGACAAALILGFIGGYPVGARTALQLYESGQCSRTEAERLLAFCNNCGPAFILGVVGAGIFNSSRIGLLLYLIHMAACVAVGVLFRFYRPQEPPANTVRNGVQFRSVRFSAAFTRSVLNALQASLNICAFIVVFTVILRMLTVTGLLHALSDLAVCLLAPLGLTQAGAQRLLTGLLELSSGVASLTDGPLSGRLPMAAFMLGWAGLSVHLQVISFMGDSGLSVRTYLAGKLLHGLLSAALIRTVLPMEAPVPVILQEQAETIVNLDFSSAVTVSCLCAGGLWLIFFVFAYRAAKKSSRKRIRHAL